MKKLLFALLAIALAVPPKFVGAQGITAADKTILYISPSGSNSNDGSFDTPFLTIEKARDTLREMKKNGTIGANGAVVYLKEGTYNISDTITFTAEDSGTPSAPITYRAYGDDKVSLIGGMILPYNKFKKTTDTKILSQIIDKKAADRVVELDLRAIGYKGPLPALKDMTREGEYVPEKAWSQPIKMYVGDKLMNIAQYPNEGAGTISIKRLVKMCQNTDYWLTRKSSHPSYIPPEKRDPTDPLIFEPSDNRYKSWAEDSGNGFLYGYFGVAWYKNVVTFTIDKSAGTISSKYPLLYMDSTGEGTSTFVAMNMLCELDADYEFFVDDKGKMYCILPDGAENEEIFFATATDSMIKLDSGCSNLIFRGLDFDKSAGKSFETKANSSNIVLYDCANANNGGIMINGKNNGMKYCRSYTGGVTITGGDVEKLVSAGNYAENCDLIANGTSPAINISGGVGNRISYCDIHDGDAILAGVYGIKHIFEYNNVHDGVRDSSDAGAVYGTLMSKGGVCDRGNIFRYNYIHDINSTSTIQAGVSGIYTDDCSSGSLIVGNIFEKINNGDGRGIHLAGSNDTIIDNNIFTDMKMAVLFDDRQSWATVNDPENSIILSNIYKTYKGYFENEYWRAEFPELYAQFHNLDKSKLGEAWNCRKTNNISVRVGEDKIANSFKNLVIKDNYSTSSDPGFVDAANGNYMLKEDSPVFDKIDFKQIPATRIGMYDERALKRIHSSVVLKNDSPYAFVGGKQISVGGDGVTITPVEIDDSIYIPLRFVSEGMKAEVAWNDETNSADIKTKEGKVVRLTINSNDAVVDGNQVKLDKAPVLIGDRTFVPIRAFSENIGYKVFWDESGLICVSLDDRFDADADSALISYLSDELNIY